MEYGFFAACTAFNCAIGKNKEFNECSERCRQRSEVYNDGFEDMAEGIFFNTVDRTSTFLTEFGKDAPPLDKVIVGSSGSVTGSALGSAIGGFLGTIVPILGTGAGATVGGVLGSMIGSHMATKTVYG